MRKHTTGQINLVYKKVIALIEQGSTISGALKKISFDRHTFYKRITPDQKLQLKMATTANTTYGQGSAFESFSTHKGDKEKRDISWDKVVIENEFWDTQAILDELPDYE